MVGNDGSIDFFEGRHITIIAPHNDDEILGCMHLIETISQKAVIDIIFVTLHDDNYTLTQQRRLESAAALANFEINDILYWDLPDGKLVVAKAELLEEFSKLSSMCDLVLCPAPNDKTLDHIPIAEMALMQLSRDQLIWYRSTWWTFQMRKANFIVTGKLRDKINVLKLFRSQSNIALHRSVWLSCLEHLLVKGAARSSEAFVFADKRHLKKKPFNSISLRHIYRMFFWV